MLNFQINSTTAATTIVHFTNLKTENRVSNQSKAGNPGMFLCTGQLIPCFPCGLTSPAPSLTTLPSSWMDQEGEPPLPMCSPL